MTPALALAPKYRCDIKCTHEITPSHNHSALRNQYIVCVFRSRDITDRHLFPEREDTLLCPPGGGGGGGESVLIYFPFSRAHLGQARSKRQSSCDLLCSDAHDAVPW